MPKVKVKKDIEDGTKALTVIMKEGLKLISDAEIKQIMKNYRNATKSQKPNAIKDIKQSGVADYKDQLLTAMAVIAGDALKKVKLEVPTKKKIVMREWCEDSLMLGEFDKLPATVKKRIKAQIDLLVKTQKNDLDKSIMLQFSSSYESTDSNSILEFDLEEAANKYINGPAIPAGASVASARGINESRAAYFFEPDVLAEIEAFQFLNDDPVTPICQDLNGTIFATNDPGFDRYQVPLHFNCKSYIIAILMGNLDGRPIERLQPSSKELEDSIQFHDRKCCSGRVGLINIDTNAISTETK